MTAILLVILKLIGWLVFGLLGAAVCVLVLVLLLPIPYHIWVRGEPGREPLLECRIRIFGFQLFPQAKADLKKQRSKKQKKTAEEEEETRKKEVPIETQEPEQKKAQKQTCAQDKQQQKATETPIKKQTKEESEKESEKKVKNKTKTAAKKKFSQETLAKWKPVWKELSDEGNHRALAHMLRECRYLLRHLGPRRLDADAAFSLGEPANTGYATAALSFFPVVYGKHCSIQPDFSSEKLYVKGWLEVHGHIRVIHALCSGLRLFFDKDIRMILKKVKKK